jgi:hypothetical protein
MAFGTAFSVLLAASTAFAAPIEPVVSRRGNLPTPIAVATARTYLSQLTVEAENNSPAYDRDLFNHWITISGTCNARETVLKRDGSNVVTSSACAATSGSWYSDYDGLTFTVSSEVDIDHLVPLVRSNLAIRMMHVLISSQKEAWVSGARTWTNARREAFANE